MRVFHTDPAGLNDRETLLRAVFTGLEREQLLYCVSRNTAAVFEEGSSDVDLLIQPRDLEQAFVASRDGAVAAGFLLISRTRFANLSLVFWKPGGFFMRIDFETEIRWRIWPLLGASTMLKDCARVGDVLCASEAVEVAILVAKALWSGKMTDRYRKRLECLTANGTTLNGPLPLPLVGKAIGGRIGALRRTVIGMALASPQAWPALLRNLFHDLGRAIGRVLHPPGVYLAAHVSEALPRQELEERMEMAFPPAKAVWGNDDSGLKDTAKALFRGGLVVQEMIHDQPLAFHKARSRNPGIWMAKNSHRFQLMAAPGCGCFLGHPATGRMWPIDAKGKALDLADGIAQAMARAWDGSKPRARTGVFAVLVGLDGSGKTTFARNLCCAQGNKTGFGVIRYFHWLPKWRGAEFPWPAAMETPRKSPKSGNVASVVSVMRLGYHLLLAWWRNRLVTAPAVRRGELVLVDRFLYNYWLDPVSLKYSGPAWCLQIASMCMPKPDLILSLEADVDTILSRKNELTREEIAIQSERLQRLPLHGTRRVVINAAQDPERVLDDAIRALGRS